MATGAQMRIPARGQVIALATALQESGLRNLNGGDRDSLGLFQQRPSQGWGAHEQIMDLVYAATKFYKALKSLKDWQNLPLSVAAQKVQKSGFPTPMPSTNRSPSPFSRPSRQTSAPRPPSPPRPRRSLTVSGADCITQAGTDYGDIPRWHTARRLPDSRRRAHAGMQRDPLGPRPTRHPLPVGRHVHNPHGANPRDRCDCSLTQRAYGVAGIEISRTTYTQINDGRAVPITVLQPGDLVFTEGNAAWPEHVSMAIGDGLVVHAPRRARR
ncbi:C40 family peptidase [Streptomyces sp. NPDC015127]|uniref:C40 family peptidase n=1 Tax=Streptomyces sp. NPDC015127 TaxID=3364939 RepID=UPI0036F9CD08